MYSIVEYEVLFESHTFIEFLDKLLDQFQKDHNEYNLVNGFVSLLDEEKIEERFAILTSIGRFRNTDGVHIVSAKEVDILSIVYISKKSLFKDNVYVDYIQKDAKDIFLYLEFKDMLDRKDRRLLEIFLDKLKNMIMQKDWNL